MTKKRFIKLLMSQGASRNEARMLAYWYNLRGISYADAYSKERLRHSIHISAMIDAFKNGILQVAEAARLMGEALKKI